MPLGNPQFQCSGLFEAGKIIIELEYFLSQQPQFLNEGHVRMLVSRFGNLEGALREACMENTPGFLNERLERINKKLQEALSNKDACLSSNATEWIVGQREGNVLFTRSERIALRRELTTRFSISELRTLAYEMGGDDYESIVGSQTNRDDFVRELIATVERKGELQFLVNECEARQPGGNWQEVKLATFPKWLEIAWWRKLLDQINESSADEIVDIDEYPVVLLLETKPTKSQLKDVTFYTEGQEALVSSNSFQGWSEEIQQDIQHAAYCYAFNMYSASVMLAWRAVKLALQMHQSRFAALPLPETVRKSLTQTIEENVFDSYISGYEDDNQASAWNRIEYAIKLIESLYEGGNEAPFKIPSILEEMDAYFAKPD